MRNYSATLILPLALAAATLALHPAAAQQKPADIAPKVDVYLGYNHIQANAPPGVSNDFSMNGGFAGADFHVKSWLALTAEVTGGHANDISNLGQGLTLTTFAAGPRLQYGHHRFVPFGQALFGGAHGSDSYFPSGTSYTTSATSFAYSAGGGLDINLTRRIAIRAIEAQFLHTSFNNGSSNVQRHLSTGAGIVFKFGGHAAAPPPPPPMEAARTKPTGDIHFSCSINVLRVMPGDPLRILGDTMTEPDNLTVMYTWMPDGGMIEGDGREVILNTTGMAPGRHIIRGHAAVTGDYSLAADCAIPFEILAPPTPPPPPPPPPAAAAEVEFHANVADAYFDYNSAVLRPDAQVAAIHAADYLNSHRSIRVRVEGFADERGTVPYNLMLGQQRAEAARNLLLAAGVDADRVEIVSYGKAMPVCTQADEECYRQNRRAAFSLHP